MPQSPLKTYTCRSCGYAGVGVKERYFEKSCMQELASLRCGSCSSLFVDAVSWNWKYTNWTKVYHDLSEEEKKTVSIFDYMAKPDKLIPGKERKRIKCLHCSSGNTQYWQADEGLCPRCGAGMDESDFEPVKLPGFDDFRDFGAMIQSAPQVVVCYMSDWCIPCQMYATIIQEIQRELPEEFSFVSVDRTYAKNLKLHYKREINHYPFFLLFQDGIYKGKCTRFHTKPEFINKLRSVFAG